MIMITKLAAVRCGCSCNYDGKAPLIQTVGFAIGMVVTSVIKAVTAVLLLDLSIDVNAYVAYLVDGWSRTIVASMMMTLVMRDIVVRAIWPFCDRGCLCDRMPYVTGSTDVSCMLYIVP